MQSRRLVLASAAFVALAACQSNAQNDGGAPPPNPSPPVGSCDPNAARGLEGRMKISDADAKRLTGAKVVRQVRPGDPVTMDLNVDRLTIENDPASGRIVRASCG